MADLIRFNLPHLNNYESKELKALRNYLTLLTRQVEYHLNNIDEDNYTTQYAEQINSAVSGVEDAEEKITALRGNVNQLTQSTGWQDIIINNKYFAHYSADQKLQYRKYGNLVEIRGAAKPTTNVTLTNNDTSYVIATLPTKCRPSKMITLLCHGSGLCIWRCLIKPDGTINVSRYQKGGVLNTFSSGGSTVQGIKSGDWLPIHTTFFID